VLDLAAGISRHDQRRAMPVTSAVMSTGASRSPVALVTAWR
jgi:hypothetical protein